MKNLLVYGGSVTDAVALHKANLICKENSITLCFMEGGDHVMETVEIKPESQAAETIRSVRPLDELVGRHQDLFHIRTDGGGFNSSIEFADLGEEFGHSTAFLDISEESGNVRATLGPGVTYHSISIMRQPTNILLEDAGGSGRIKIVSPYQYLDDFDQENTSRLENRMDLLFMNSPKDPEIIDRLIKVAGRRGVPMGFALTDMLPQEYQLKSIVPYGTVIFNIKELAKLWGDSPPEGRDKKIKMGKKYLSLLKELQTEPYNIYITLGRHGLMGTTESGYFVINLSGEAFEIVRGQIENNPVKENGLGDRVAAFIFAFEQSGRDDSHTPLGVAKSALVRVAKHFGYKGKFALNYEEGNL